MKENRSIIKYLQKIRKWIIYWKNTRKLICMIVKSQKKHVNKKSKYKFDELLM